MKRIFFGIISLLTIAACNDDDTKSQVHFYLQPEFNGVELLPNEVIQNENGRNFSMYALRVYITDLFLINENDEKIRVNDISLIDWPATNEITAKIPMGTYKGIEFHVGLDAEDNNSNPIDFENSHPLSADQEMHWGMIKYRFLTFLGNVDTSTAGNLAPHNLLQYHLGRDVLYSAVNISGDFNVTSSLQYFPISFNVDEMFNGTAGTIDIAVHRTNHSGEADMDKAAIIMNNFVEALEN